MVARGSPTLQIDGIHKAKVEGSSPLFLAFLLLAHANHVPPLRKSLHKLYIPESA
jgi:predicted methyltransferase